VPLGSEARGAACLVETTVGEQASLAMHRRCLMVAPADYCGFNSRAVACDVSGYLRGYIGRIAAAHLPLLGIDDNPIRLRQPDSYELNGSRASKKIDNAGTAGRERGRTNHGHEAGPYLSCPDRRCEFVVPMSQGSHFRFALLDGISRQPPSLRLSRASRRASQLG
jgi:hypothetical protein